MNRHLALAALLAFALIIPVAASTAASTAAPTDQQQATVAKKKLSYCQRKGKAAKGKLISKVKSAKS